MREPGVVLLVSAAATSRLLPPNHDLETVTGAAPGELMAVLEELRARRTPVVAVLDAGTVKLSPVLTEITIKYPEVAVVVASPPTAPVSEAASRAVTRTAGTPALVASIRQSLRAAVQQARVRTTLDRFNIRLAANDAVPDDRQQRRLLLSGLYLANILDGASDAIFVADRAGIVTLWNRTAEQLFDTPAGSIVGHPLDVLGARLGGHDLLRMVRGITPAQPSGRADLMIQTANGTREVEVSLSLVAGAEGEGIAVSGIARDLSERNALYRELQEKADALAESNRHKEEFLAVLSHELRTPLNSVLGWAQILETMPHDADRVRRAAAMITRNAQLQRRLVMDLLDYARIASEQLTLHLEVQDVSALAGATVDSLRPEFEEKGLQIVEEYAPGARARVDVERLDQVVSNLLANALKFTPRGGTVTVTVRTDEDGVELEVRDTGRGIAPDFVPHVFDAFRQASTSTNRTESGLGLGLAITRRIVELHDGRISAHSAGPGRGATFCVTLPPAAPASVAAAV